MLRHQLSQIMHRVPPLGATTLGFLWATAMPLDAAIVGGTITPIAPPTNVGADNQQINALLGFDEQQNVLLTQPLAIEGGTIPAGTVVRSHYIIYDPSASASITGTALFDADVLGVITATGDLSRSDFLGVDATHYLNPSLRGFEAGDVATITDTRTVRFDLEASTPGDYARVITAPEPAAAATLCLGICLVASNRRQGR